MTKITAIAISIQHWTTGSKQPTRQQKDMMAIQIGKEEIKLPPSVDDMSLYILHKIIHQKPIVFL